MSTLFFAIAVCVIAIACFAGGWAFAKLDEPGEARKPDGYWPAPTPMNTPRKKSDLELEWETAKGMDPETNRCGQHKVCKGSNLRCLRPEHHDGGHRFL